MRDEGVPSFEAAADDQGVVTTKFDSLQAY